MTASKRYPIILAVVFIFFTLIASADENKVNIHRKYCCFVHFPSICANFNIEIIVSQDCTDIARDDVPLLVFSTLGGGLTAVDPITSEIRWSIDDGA